MKNAVFVLVVLVLLFLCVVRLDAAPTTPTQAEKVVIGWLKANAQPLGMALGQEVTDIETFSDADEQPIYYVVYLEPTGFVIVPADDLAEPIIAFVEEGIYDPSPDNPLGALVSHDLPMRIAAVRNQQIATISQLQKKELTEQQIAIEIAGVKAQNKWVELQDYANVMQTLGLSSISDVWVDPLVQSKWNQGSVGGNYCYNYYTPNHYVCGCVATAFAQLLRFHEYPTAGIGVHDFTVKVNGVDQIVSTRGGDGAGGPYNWDLMVFEPVYSSPPAQRQAIGALCYDAGVSIETGYTSSGSGSSVGAIYGALKNVFEYDNVESQYGSTNDTTNTNLDANLPVLFSISGGGRHAVVCDGYGYDFETIYHHINMGWGGSSDAWYNLPDIGSYDTIRTVLYNIFPTGSGEIISGRVTDGGENPMSGVMVSADTGSQTYNANTNNKGIYALARVPSSTTFTVSASKSGYTFVPQRVTIGDTGNNKWGINFQGVSGSHPVIWTNVDEFEFTKAKGGSDPEPQILSIWNSGFGTLDWEITHNCNWLSIEPNSGSSTGEPDEVTLTITDLTPGTYNCELTISAPGALNSPKTIQLNLLIGGSLRLVPSQYPTIQDAINASLDIYGDVVIVEPNTYTGPGNRGIDFNGKPITVRSVNPNDPATVAATIIDCNGSEFEPYYGFYFGTGVGPNPVLSGLTITNGYIDGGGAIFCYNSSPEIANCVLINNTALGEGGGAIFCLNSHPTIINCTIKGNLAIPGGGIGPMDFGGDGLLRGGGGIGLHGSDANIVNCIISANQAQGDEFSGTGGGGAIWCMGSDPVITNCTLVNNTAIEGGGIYCSTSNPVIINSIFWDNAPEQIHVYSGAPVVAYSDVEGGWSGDGNNNIMVDPCFADTSSSDPNQWDYHLQSQAGRWDPNTSTWAIDSNTSPCIDMGNPGCSLMDEPNDTNNVRINMGAYGGTAQASKTPIGWGLLADLTNDWIVNFLDYAVFLQWALPADEQPWDLNRDGQRDFRDLRLLTDDWLKQRNLDAGL